MHENESKNPQTEVDLEVKFPFACDNCEKRFTSKESLRNHLKRIHQIEQSAVCNTCGRIFKNHQELRIHWKSEGKNKISEKMSFEESVTFFASLAYIAHIKKITQPFHLFQQKLT